MDKDKINKILKYLVIIGLIVLMINVIIFKFSNCDKCSFKINQKNLNAPEFLNYYFEKCPVKNNVLDKLNFTFKP